MTLYWAQLSTAKEDASKVSQTRELYVIAGPSGGGKTSLFRALLDRFDHLALSVSDTTRPPRATETDGEQYCFIDEATFKAGIDAGRYLEYAQVFGHYYGTSKDRVQALWDQGQDVILEIDIQGAVNIRQRHPEASSIFILPPSMAVLAQRLRHRGLDDEAVIARRLSEAKEEIAAARSFDWLVINDDFERAFAELSAIVEAWPTRCARRLGDIDRLLAE